MKSKFKLQSLLRPALVAGVSAVLLFAILTIVSPEVRAATLGWLTQFVEVDSPQALQPSIDKPAGVSAAGEAATINPEATSTTGLPKPDSLKISGQSAELPVPDAQPSRELISVEAAQAEVDFKIGVPSTLPAGYSVLGVVPKPKASDLKVQPPADLPKADLPKAAQLQVATLIMSNSAGDMLTLSEARMTSSVPADVSLPAGKGSVQNVTINGQSGQYVEGMWTDKGWVATGLHQLHWQDANGITFDLISSKLGLNDLLAIAESIQ
jgi:hypothetical protein